MAPDGSMHLNGVSVSIDEFRTSIENIVDASSEPVNLFIRGDERVEYGAIVNVMDTAKIAGVEKISLVSDIHEKEIPATLED